MFHWIYEGFCSDFCTIWDDSLCCFKCWFGCCVALLSCVDVLNIYIENIHIFRSRFGSPPMNFFKSLIAETVNFPISALSLYRSHLLNFFCFSVLYLIGLFLIFAYWICVDFFLLACFFFWHAIYINIILKNSKRNPFSQETKTIRRNDNE